MNETRVLKAVHFIYDYEMFPCLSIPFNLDDELPLLLYEIKRKRQKGHCINFRTQTTNTKQNVCSV